MEVEEHVDDCGEDLSSLPGVESCTFAWTTTLHDDSLPMVPDEAYSTECDRLWAFMLFGPHRIADMRHHKVIRLPSMSDFDQLTNRQPILRDVAELSGSEPRATKLAVRRVMNTGAVMDFLVEADLKLPATQQLVLNYFQSSQAPIVVLAPASPVGHKPVGC